MNSALIEICRIMYAKDELFQELVEPFTIEFKKEKPEMWCSLFKYKPYVEGKKLKKIKPIWFIEEP